MPLVQEQGPLVRLTELPLFAPISVATTGDNTIVTGVAGKVIRVVKVTVVAGGAVSITWKSGSTSLSGAMALAANGGIADSFTPSGILQTNDGDNLILNLSGNISVGGYLTYVFYLTGV